MSRLPPRSGSRRTPSPSPSVAHLDSKALAKGTNAISGTVIDLCLEDDDDEKVAPAPTPAAVPTPTAVRAAVSASPVVINSSWTSPTNAFMTRRSKSMMESDSILDQTGIIPRSTATLYVGHLVLALKACAGAPQLFTVEEHRIIHALHNISQSGQAIFIRLLLRALPFYKWRNDAATYALVAPTPTDPHNEGILKELIGSGLLERASSNAQWISAAATRCLSADEVRAIYMGLGLAKQSSSSSSVFSPGASGSGSKAKLVESLNNHVKKQKNLFGGEIQIDRVASKVLEGNPCVRVTARARRIVQRGLLLVYACEYWFPTLFKSTAPSHEPDRPNIVNLAKAVSRSNVEFYLPPSALTGLTAVLSGEYFPAYELSPMGPTYLFDTRDSLLKFEAARELCMALEIVLLNKDEVSTTAEQELAFLQDPLNSFENLVKRASDASVSILTFLGGGNLCPRMLSLAAVRFCRELSETKATSDTLVVLKGDDSPLAECPAEVARPRSNFVKALCKAAGSEGAAMHFEQQSQYREAVEALELVLRVSTTYNLGNTRERARWYNRLSIDIGHLGQKDEVRTIVTKALAEFGSGDGDEPNSYYALRARAQKVGADIPEEAPTGTQVFPTVVIHAKGSSAPQGGRVEYYAEEDDDQNVKRVISFEADEDEPAGSVPMSPALDRSTTDEFVDQDAQFSNRTSSQRKMKINVEELALNQYREHGGWVGVHSEGSQLQTIFALLMWDVIFMPGVPHAFLTPFQTQPRDLSGKKGVFFNSRAGAITAKLAAIRGMTLSSLVEELTERFRETRGVRAVGLTHRLGCTEDERDSSDRVVIAAAVCLGPARCAALCEIYAMNFVNFKSGAPDLLLLRVVRTDNVVEQSAHDSIPASSPELPKLVDMEATGSKADYQLSERLLNHLIPIESLIGSPSAPNPPFVFESKLVEVKSKQDALAHRQVKWLNALIRIGVQAEVAWIADPDTNKKRKGFASPAAAASASKRPRPTRKGAGPVVAGDPDENVFEDDDDEDDDVTFV